jgi:fumarylacetoacetase
MSTATWVDGAAGSPYDVDNLPYGVFSHGDESPRVCVRIGDHALDLAPAAAADMFPVAHLFEAGDLAPFMGAGRAMWTSVREWVTALLTDEAERSLVEPLLLPVDELTMHLPWRSPTTSTSTAPWTTPPTWAGCSGPTRSR